MEPSDISMDKLFMLDTAHTVLHPPDRATWDAWRATHDPGELWNTIVGEAQVITMFLEVDLYDLGKPFHTVLTSTLSETLRTYWSATWDEARQLHEALVEELHEPYNAFLTQRA